jgi:hypothetical protein
MIIKCPQCGRRNRLPNPPIPKGKYTCKNPDTLGICNTLLLYQEETMVYRALIPYNHKNYDILTEQRRKVDRALVFDPALKHLSDGIRLGNPQFKDPEISRQWLQTRRQVMDHLLEIIINSPWYENLVLRGSLLLKAWLGDRAREPGDIDWVCQPQNIHTDHPLATEILYGLIQLVSDQPQIGTAIIDTDNIAISKIWAYERADGQRLVFPWKATGLPPGELQMDMVFGEELPIDPILVDIPSPTGVNRTVWAAGKELSLAWKILWLETDCYPQGKDLYDAALLAEQAHRPLETIQRVLEAKAYWKAKPGFSANPSFQWSIDIDEIDWENFQLEYPWIEGTANDWQLQLSKLLQIDN